MKSEETKEIEKNERKILQRKSEKHRKMRQKNLGMMAASARLKKGKG